MSLTHSHQGHVPKSVQMRTVPLWALPWRITYVSLLPETEFSLLPSTPQNQPTASLGRLCIENLLLPSHAVTVSLILLGAMKVHSCRWSVPVCPGAEFFTLVRLPPPPNYPIRARLLFKSPLGFCHVPASEPSLTANLSLNDGSPQLTF